MTFLKPLINQHDILKSCTRTCFNNHHWTEIDRKWKLTQSANSVLDTIVTAVDNVSDCRSPPHCSQKMGHIEYIYWEHYWICAMSTTLTALVYHDNMPPGESVGRHRALQCCSAAVLQCCRWCTHVSHCTTHCRPSSIPGIYWQYSDHGAVTLHGVTCCNSKDQDWHVRNYNPHSQHLMLKWTTHF